MIVAGVLRRDERPFYYAYRLTWQHQGKQQVETGLAAVASLSAYAENRIRRHEHTTPPKEHDRVRQIEAVNAQTGPVMLAYPAAAALDALLERAAAGAAAIDVTAEDGVRHQLWVIDDVQTIAALTRAVEALPALYIADGHHRAAAAFRVAEARGGGAGGADGDDYFLAVLLPENQMTILDYNRVLRDLNGRSAAELLAEIRRRCTVEPSDRPVRPTHAQEFGMVLAGRWYRLRVRPADRAEPGAARDAGPVARLPVTLLARTIIEPLFAITDPRTDQRIDFVGGGRGLAELERLVTSGEMAAAFALYPTQMRDLMAVADAGAVMPPKSTWFEPKLADGMVSHVLD